MRVFNRHIVSCFSQCQQIQMTLYKYLNIRVPRYKHTKLKPTLVTVNSLLWVTVTTFDQRFLKNSHNSLYIPAYKLTGRQTIYGIAFNYPDSLIVELPRGVKNSRGPIPGRVMPNKLWNWYQYIHMHGAQQWGCKLLPSAPHTRLPSRTAKPLMFVNSSPSFTRAVH